MPKEVIRDAEGLHGTMEDPIDLAAEVRWGIETFVQIATVNLANEGQSDASYGWFIELDRSAINKLIKTLRKARDQAYGADE